jgi:hypothetical protein
MSKPKRHSRHCDASPAKLLGLPKILLVSINGLVGGGGGAVIANASGLGS